MKNLEKFYNQTYGSSHILKNNLHIRWQFKKNPFLKKDKTSIIVYKHHGEIVSHLGFIPVRLKFFNSTKLEISLPIKAAKNIKGIKPINVVIINFVLEIFNVLQNISLHVFHYGTNDIKT